VNRRSTPRSERRARCASWALGLLLLPAALCAQSPRKLDLPPGFEGDFPGHGEASKPYDSKDWSPEERRRLDHLFGQIVCACPKEGWSKTLAGCPDGCSEKQKAEVRAALKAGKTDEEIIAEQVRIYGTEQVKALPDSPLAHLFPFVALGALAVLAVAFLVRSVRPRRPGAAEPPPAAAVRAEGPAAGQNEIEEAVERDLREMDE
jgi:cytochrome c-type biogenesis protein CcmH/NrfF